MKFFLVVTAAKQTEQQRAAQVKPLTSLRNTCTTYAEAETAAGKVASSHPGYDVYICEAVVQVEAEVEVKTTIKPAI